jgi:hypothetical protein
MLVPANCPTPRRSSRNFFFLLIINIDLFRYKVFLPVPVVVRSQHRAKSTLLINGFASVVLKLQIQRRTKRGLVHKNRIKFCLDFTTFPSLQRI